MAQTDRIPSATAAPSKRSNIEEYKAGTDRERPSKKSAAVSSYTPEGKTSPEAWVKKWVDYSSKYGLGYILSNGSVGVFFNDSTKIVLEPTGNSFYYFERSGPDRQDISRQCSLTEYPKEL